MKEKIIYKVTKTKDDSIIKEKLIVVYKNNTYTYCKVYGNDSLECIKNKDIDLTLESLLKLTSGTIYAYTDAENDSMLKGMFRHMRYKQYKKEIEKNKIWLKQLKDRIKNYEDSIKGMEKFIDEYEKDNIV